MVDIETMTTNEIADHLATRYDCVVLITDGERGPNSALFSMFIPPAVNWCHALGCIEWGRDKAKAALAKAEDEELGDES